MRTLQKVLIFLLVLAVIGFGYWIYMGQDLAVSPVNNNVTYPTPTTVNSPKFKQPAASQASAEEFKVLAAGLPAGSTSAQMKVYSDKVAAAAVASEVLDLTACNPTPNVFRFSAGKKVSLQNKDSVAHTLTFGSPVVTLATVPANSIIETTISAGAGIIGYACDGRGPIGMLFIDAK